MDQTIGMKEMYDISIRLNQPLMIGERQYDINETILNIEKAEIAQVQQVKSIKSATGGYQNRTLVEWEVDKECKFAITHGLISTTSLAIISNSKIKERKTKSINYREKLTVIEDNDFWFVDLKFMPNHINGTFGLQYNPENEKMPMGRKPYLPLKPLPPQRDKFIFCYDAETGYKIKNFDICGNRIVFHAEHKFVIVDYTFDYDDGLRELNIGNRLLGGYLNLSAKMTTKDHSDGKVKTAIIEMPKIKLASNLNMKLGEEIGAPIVSDFFFIAYPNESRTDETVCYLSFLNSELTDDYR